MRALFSSAVQLLQKNLDLRLERQQILASNVANAETPKYLAKDLDFAETLREAALPAATATAIVRTHAQHFPPPARAVPEVQGTVVAAQSHDVGRDLNTVSMDEEMSKLTTNTMHYNASTELLGRLLSQLKHTINEGGR